MTNTNTEILVMDGAYVPYAVIDEYESFVWTERFQGHGDFILVAQPTAKLKKLLTFSSYLGLAESDFVMQVETVFNQTKDGKTYLTVTGRTLTLLLDGRGVSGNWVGNGTAGYAMTNLVTIICKDGTGISPYDAIPGFYTENLTTATEIIQTKPEQARDLHTVIKGVAEASGTGYRIVVKKPNGNPQIWFQAYNGTYRPELLFSVDNDTLLNPSYLQSIENYRNIAYVHHKQGIRIVSKFGISPTISGYARKVITVNATDIEPADHVPAVYDNLLIQRGVEAMASADGRRINLYDGEVPTDIPYEYRKDYFLGDIVGYTPPEGASISAEKQLVRITEYIRSCDSEGRKAYPTFSVVD